MLPTALLRLIRSQAGAFSRAQAVAAGLSVFAVGRRVRSGEWQRVFPGVYRLDVTVPGFELRAHAAMLWGGPPAVLSHQTAAWLWKLGTLEHAPKEIDLTLTQADHRVTPPGLLLHRPRFQPEHRVLVERLPCTTLAQTLLDLAAEVDEEQLESAVEAGLLRRGDDLRDELARLLARARGRHGAPTLRQLLDLLAGAPSESRFEVRVHRALRRAKFPKAERQFLVSDASGVPIARLDFAWPARNLGLMADGRKYHAKVKAFERDPEQQNRLAALGWRLCRVTPETLRWPTWLQDLTAAYAASNSGLRP